MDLEQIRLFYKALDMSNRDNVEIEIPNFKDNLERISIDYLLEEFKTLKYNLTNNNLGNNTHQADLEQLNRHKMKRRQINYFNNLFKEKMSYHDYSSIQMSERVHNNKRKECKVFTEINKVPTLYNRCLKYVHKSLKLSEFHSPNLLFSVYLNQPHIIENLNLPSTIKRDLNRLFQKCTYHANFVGFEDAYTLQPDRFSFRENTYLWKLLKRHPLFNNKELFKFVGKEQILLVLRDILGRNPSINIERNFDAFFREVQEFT